MSGVCFKERIGEPCSARHDHEPELPPFGQRADAVEEGRQVRLDIDRLLLGRQVIWACEYDQQAKTESSRASESIDSAGRSARTAAQE